MTASENAKIREVIAKSRGDGRLQRIHLQDPLRPDLPVRPSDRTASWPEAAGAPIRDAAGRSTGHEERQPYPGRGSPHSWVNPPRANS